MTKVRPLIVLAALAASSVVVAQTPPPTGGSSQTTTTSQTPLLEEDYKIQAEDRISIVVADISEPSGEYLVGKDGRIDVPLVGEIDVVGKTRKELATLLTEKLKKEVRDPRVTINITSTSLRRIYTLGAVKTGGILDWKPQWRLTEVIAAAGGLAAPAERTKVLVFRKGVNHMTIKMKDLLVDGKDECNIEILPNDVVNFQTDVQIRVQVVGQVGRQGLTEVLQGQGVAEVLAAAGGGTQDARLSGAKLMRDGKEIPVDLYTAVVKGETSKNMSVEDGDTLIIPSLLNKVSVIGQVGKPGPIIVPDGEQLTLTRAVSLAGGPGRGAKLDSVGIVRLGPDRKPIATKYDLKALLKGDPKNRLVDPVLQDGDLVVIAQSGKSGMGEIGQGFGVFGFLSRFFPF